MSQPRRPSRSGTLTVVGAGALMVVCCAGPLLIAGGVLSGLGSALHSLWLIAPGVVIIAAAAGYPIVHRIQRRHAEERGCSPSDRFASAADIRDDPTSGP